MRKKYNPLPGENGIKLALRNTNSDYAVLPTHIAMYQLWKKLESWHYYDLNAVYWTVVLSNLTDVDMI